MKILIAHNFYRQPGGEDAVVRHEQELLTERGEDVHLHSVDNRDIRRPWDEALVALRLGYNRSAKRKLTRVLEQIRPDVMHVHNFFPLLSPAIFDAAAEAGVATVFTLHNFRILCPTSFLYHDDEIRERSLHHSCWWTVPKRVYRNSLLGTLALAHMVEKHKRDRTWSRKVDRFIALTPYAKEKFVEGGLPPELIAVKGNSVRPKGKPEDGRVRRGALFVGRLSPEKGIRVLLNAWQDIDYPLRIVGDGPLLDEVTNAAGGTITVLGRQNPEQVRREMESAAFLVLPSVWSEMFPVTVVESMAAGLPVIASDLGGVNSIIDEGETGLFFRISDAAALREQVRWAVGNPERMTQMGLEARKRYLARHTPEQNYDRLMEIYREAIVQRAERRP